MKFSVVIHKDKNSDFGVIVPDLPGCYSAGSDYEDALRNAEEAIECHIEGMLQDGETIPQPKGIEAHQKKRDYKGGVWALVSVDVSKLSGKAKRVNITVPERLLNQMDSYAVQHGESRSGLIVNATLEYLATHK